MRKLDKPEKMKNIKLMRIKRNLSQEQLSQLTGVGQNIISQWENNAKRTPSAKNLQKVAKILKCRIEDLLEDLDDPRFF